MFLWNLPVLPTPRCRDSAVASVVSPPHGPCRPRTVPSHHHDPRTSRGAVDLPPLRWWRCVALGGGWRPLAQQTGGGLVVDGLVGELRVEEVGQLVGQLKLVKCLNSCFFFQKKCKKPDHLYFLFKFCLHDPLSWNPLEPLNCDNCGLQMTYNLCREVCDDRLSWPPFPVTASITITCIYLPQDYYLEGEQPKLDYTVPCYWYMHAILKSLPNWILWLLNLVLPKIHRKKSPYLALFKPCPFL